MDIPNSGAIFTLGKSYLAENTQSYFYIKNDPVKRLISGPHESAVICESGRLFVWGENSYGQLGIGGNHNPNNNKNSHDSDVVTKPTCVKSLKTNGLKVADVAFGNDWAVILTHSNEVFFTGRNIFGNDTNAAYNFTSTTVANEERSIIRKPFRLEEFDEYLSKSEDAEYFIAVSAGNEHFAILTSFGRLISWGSNEFYQLGEGAEQHQAHPQKPLELHFDAAVKLFACGPHSTLVLTEGGNLYISGHLNELIFQQFTQLRQNLSSTEHIVYMNISTANEIFVITNAGNIYNSIESVRNKSLIFQRFYDYDSEENGPLWKLLKSFSFCAVLTKANKFYTTFSESGHHLKTFREISKFKNLRLLDMAIGNQHILVHGIPKSTTLSATVGPEGEHRFMSRSFVMKPAEINMDNMDADKTKNDSGNGNRASILQLDNEKDIENDINGNENKMSGLQEEEEVEKPLVKEVNAIINETQKELGDAAIEIKVEAEKMLESTVENVDQLFDDALRGMKTSLSLKSPSSSSKSIKSLRPSTPYPEKHGDDATTHEFKKTPLRNYSYEAAMDHGYIERTSPALQSLNHIPEAELPQTGKKAIKANASSATLLPAEQDEPDEQLIVEINTSTDASDPTITLNEIRFINNGVDVTANVEEDTTSDENLTSTEMDNDHPLQVQEEKIIKEITKVNRLNPVIDAIEEEKLESSKWEEKISTAANKAIDAFDVVKDNAKEKAASARDTLGNIASEGKSAVAKVFTAIGDETKHIASSYASKVSSEIAEYEKKAEQNGDNDDDDALSEAISKESDLKTNTATLEDDERTTASVNSNHTSNGNPFENSNPFEPIIDEAKEHGIQALKNELISAQNQMGHYVDEEVKVGKSKIKQFFEEKGKWMSCDNEKSIRVEDDRPAGNRTQVEQNGHSNTKVNSKICSIL